MHFVMFAFSNHAMVLHNVTPIDFDIRTVFNEHNIRFRTKLRHLILIYVLFLTNTILDFVQSYAT